MQDRTYSHALKATTLAFLFTKSIFLIIQYIDTTPLLTSRIGSQHFLFVELLLYFAGEIGSAGLDQNRFCSPELMKYKQLSEYVIEIAIDFSLVIFNCYSHVCLRPVKRLTVRIFYVGL